MRSLRSVLCFVILYFPMLQARSPLPTDKECAKLSIWNCMNSSSCVLDGGTPTGKEYFCRAAQNNCEQNFKQANPDAKACTKKKGCEYVTYPCFCGVSFDPTKDAQCMCADGAPPSCRKKTKK